MFETTQKTVSIRQLAALVLFYEAAIGEPAETDERMRHAYPVVATAVSKLKRLRDELDFANAAATEFHVEATLLLDLSIDLLLRETHARERPAHRNIRTKNRRRNRCFESRKELCRSDCGARANQCLSFPGLRVVHVVTHRFLQRTRQRA